MAQYVGFKFPFQKGDTSFPAQAEDAELIKDSLIQILLTQKGERTMRPDFGSNVMAYIFDNNTPAMAELLRNEIQTAIGRFEPRVYVDLVQVVQLDATVEVDIRYIILSTGKEDTLGVSIPTPGA